MLRAIRWLSLSLLGVVVIAWGVLWLGVHRPAGPAGRLVAFLTGQTPRAAAQGVGVGGVALGGPFTLVNSQSRTVTDRSFRGRWMLVYFGYTSCPDVCPTELQTIVAALDRIGPAAAGRIAPLFITVDPARDTPAVLGRYTALFGPQLIGLTGSAAQIGGVEHAFRVYHAEVTQDGGNNYLVNHSSFMYLVGPQGRFDALYPPGLTATALADRLRRQMDTNG